MKKYTGIQKKKRISIRLLGSYLAIILAPAIAILVIYITMQEALLDIQKERSQNLSKEAAVNFNMEMEQMVNVARYISSDADLKVYMQTRETFLPTESYYKAYELANSYPDYAALNRFIKNIYILPVHTSYMLQIPQVLPNDSRGIAMLHMVNSDVSYEQMVQSVYELGAESLVYTNGAGISDNFLILQRFGRGQEAGVVVIEIEKSQIKALLRSTLGSDRGLAFLTDEAGNVLYLYDKTGKTAAGLPDAVTWSGYLEENGWSHSAVTVNKVTTEYNAWSVVTVIPQKELLSKIGWGKYAILVLCIVSVLTGVAICLWYWNRNQPVLERYMKYTEEHPEKILSGRGSTNIWKNFGGVLEHMEDLHLTVQRQKQWATDGILRKMLYGAYDSEEELESEITEAGITFPVCLPCVIAALDIENPIRQEGGISPEELEGVFRDNLERYLPYPYRVVSMNALSYAVFIFTGEESVDGEALKQLFERMNYALYSHMPVNIYTGISGTADTIPAVSEEYEHVCRICEYVRYYKLRTPLLLKDLPRHQHVVFTAELEMQLEHTIRRGTKEQLKTLMAQVGENHLNIQGGGYKPAGYILEVLRCILLRCLDEDSSDERIASLLNQVHYAKTPKDMECGIWAVWEYFADSRSVQQNQEEEHLKKQIEEKIEQEYSGVEFNLAMMADWLGMPEQKLYRDFKKMYGVSFSSYLEMLRIRHAQEFLKAGKAVCDVAAAVGYGSDYSFRRAFKRVVGVAPSDYQKLQ